MHLGRAPSSGSSTDASHQENQLEKSTKPNKRDRHWKSWTHLHLRSKFLEIHELIYVKSKPLEKWTHVYLRFQPLKSVERSFFICKSLMHACPSQR